MELVRCAAKPRLPLIGRVGLTVLAGLVLLVGCGDDATPTGGTPTGSFAGRYLGTFTTAGDGARQQNPEAGGVLSLLVAANGQVTLEVVSVLAPEAITAQGTIGATGELTTLTGTVGDGATISFTGTVDTTGGAPAASGTWSAVNGPDGPRAGTWTAAPAPAQHPFAGSYFGSYTFQEIENQRTGTMDLTVDAEGRVTVMTFQPDPPNGDANRQAAGLTGWVDPQGAFAIVAPYPAGNGVPAGSVASLGGILSTTTLQPAAMRVWPEADSRYLGGGFSIPLIAQLAVISGIVSSTTTQYELDLSRSGTLQVTTGGALFFQGVTSAGDTSADGAVQTFLTFDLTGKPPRPLHDLRQVTLQLHRTEIEGDPFTGREFFAERVEYANSPMQFGSGPRPAGTVTVPMTATSGDLALDLVDLFRPAVEQGLSTFQVRLRFEPTNDGDGHRDVVHFDVGKLTAVHYPERPMYP